LHKPLIHAFFLVALAEVDHELTADFADFLTMHADIRVSNVHDQFQADLIEHLWRIKENTAARTKYVPQTLDQARFAVRGWRCSKL
jgi:hypothetical protein